MFFFACKVLGQEVSDVISKVHGLNGPENIYLLITGKHFVHRP